MRATFNPRLRLIAPLLTVLLLWTVLLTYFSQALGDAQPAILFSIALTVLLLWRPRQTAPAGDSAALSGPDIGPALSADHQLQMERVLKDGALRLIESETRNQVIFSSRSVAVVTLDPDGRYLRCNSEWNRLVGHAEDALHHMFDLDLTHPLDVESTRLCLERLRNGEADRQRLTKRYFRKDGSVLWADADYSAMHNAAGQLREILAVIHDVTHSHRVENTLDRVFDLSADLICILDLSGRMKVVNPSFERILGLATGELTGKKLLRLIHPADREQAAEWLDGVRQGQPSTSLEVRCPRTDGDHCWISWSCTADPENARIYAIGRNVTERRQTEHRLCLLDKVFRSTGEAILITDQDNRIVEVNDALLRITGYRRDELLGRNPGIMSSGRHGPAFYRDMWHGLKQRGNWQGEVWDKRKSGEIYPKWISINAVKDQLGQVTNYVAVFSDISTIKEAERRLQQLAHYDQLTGLANRLLFLEHLEAAMARAMRHDQRLAVMFIDLDGFKEVNDTLGHGAGDDLLRQAAERLKDCTRREDVVARIGGDEFAVILSGLERTEPAQVVAQKIVDRLLMVTCMDGIEVRTSASIGIAVYPHDGTDAETILSHADQAMYAAKRCGKNNYRFFEPTMQARLLDRVQIQARLRNALEKNELYVVYQPQFSLAERRVRGLEALARWRHPKFGVISPASFIPVAEESGLIIPLGRHVMEKACHQARELMSRGAEDLVVAVNLSARQFTQKGTVDDIRAILDATGLPAERLEVELTESLVMDDVGYTVSVLRRLRDMGVKASVDDFGTGYSSLSYLKKLPVDSLKIDRSFVKDVPHDKDDVAIVTAIISMAHRLNLRVVAEGVETREQLAFLREQGCDTVQGFLVGRPVEGERSAGQIAKLRHCHDDKGGVLVDLKCVS